MSRRSRSFGALVVVMLMGCRQGAKTTAPSPDPTSEIRIGRLPPKPKDVVEALLRSSEVSLSVDSSCDGVGSDFGDRTIGRYVSGLLAEQSEPKGKNWIETTIDPDKDAAGEDIWRCHVVIRHVDGDDRWGWGVQFAVRQKDGVVLRNSYRCTGGG